MGSTTPSLAFCKTSSQSSKKPRTPWGMIHGFWHTFVSFSNPLLLLLFANLLLSRYISPTIIALSVYLGSLFLLLFALVVLQAIYWFIIRARSRAAINTVMLLLSLPVLLLYAPLRTRQTPPMDRENWIKVVSLNANIFRLTKLRAHNQHAITGYLAESDADIICLWEAWLNPNKSRYMSRHSPRHTLSNHPYYNSAYAVRGHDSHLIVLSKYPILLTRPIDLCSEFNGGVAFMVFAGEKKLVLYNLYLESFGFTREKQVHYSQLTQGVNPKSLTQAVGEHFSPTPRRRTQQVKQIYQDTNYQESPYLPICGDLNSTPISYTHYYFSVGLYDAIATTGRGTSYNYYFKSFIDVHINHMLYSDQIVVQATRMDRPVNISDYKLITCYSGLR